MPSKKYVYELTLDEALQKLDLLLYDRNCDIRVIQARQQLIDVIRKETNKLKQDLEVLEILKKCLNIKIPYGSLTVISACNGDDYLLFEVELEEHTKIEEWLENEQTNPKD